MRMRRSRGCCGGHLADVQGVGRVEGRTSLSLPPAPVWIRLVTTVFSAARKVPKRVRIRPQAVK